MDLCFPFQNWFRNSCVASQNASEFNDFFRTLRRKFASLRFLFPFRIGAAAAWGWAARKLSPSFSWKPIPSFFSPSSSSSSVWCVIGMIWESLSGPGITTWSGEKFPMMEKYFSSSNTFLLIRKTFFYTFINSVVWWGVVVNPRLSPLCIADCLYVWIL